MITQGLTVSLSNEVIGTEIISLGEVKTYLNITFDAHDTKLDRLIAACRSALEQFKSVTLIQSRSVALSWQTFTDYEDLLYLPIVIDNDNEFVVTDLEGVTIPSSDYSIVNIAGRVVFKGEFPNGLIVRYNATQLQASDFIKEKLIRAVAESFESEVTPYEAVKKQFKYVQV